MIKRISLDIWVMKMSYSEAQKEATARYNKKTYDRISLVVPKGHRKRIADYAAMQGKSMNRFILDAIAKEMQHSASDDCPETKE